MGPALGLAGDGPDEAAQLTRYGGGHLLLGLARLDQMLVAPAQPFLSLPGHRLDFWACELGALFYHPGLSGWKAVVPGRLHQSPPEVPVARLGDAALFALGAAAVLAGHQAQVGHQLRGLFKAAHIAQLGQYRHRRDHADSAQSHQIHEHWLQIPALDDLRDLHLHRCHARLALFDRIDVLLQHDLLDRHLKLDCLEPVPVGLGPLALALVAPAVAQQERAKPLARLGLGLLEVFPRTAQIPNALMGLVGHPHRRQAVVAVQLGQTQRVAPVGLDPIAGLFWNH